MPQPFRMKNTHRVCRNLAMTRDGMLASRLILLTTLWVLSNMAVNTLASTIRDFQPEASDLHPWPELSFLETRAEATVRSKWLYFKRHKGASGRHHDIVKHHRVTEETLYNRALSDGRLNDTTAVPYLDYLVTRLVRTWNSSEDQRPISAVQEEAGATGDDVWYWIDDTSNAVEALSASPNLFTRYRNITERLVEFLLSSHTSCPEAPSIIFRRHAKDSLWLDSEPGDVEHVRAHSAMAQVTAELPFGRIWHSSRYHGVEQPFAYSLKPFQVRFAYEGRTFLVDADVDTISSSRESQPSKELAQLIVASDVALNMQTNHEGRLQTSLTLSFLLALRAEQRLVAHVNISYTMTEGHADTTVSIHAYAAPGERVDNVEVVLQQDVSHRKATEYTRIYALEGDAQWGDGGGGCSRANASSARAAVPRELLPQPSNSSLVYYAKKDKERFLRWMALSQKAETETGGLAGVHSLFVVYHDPLLVKAVSYSAEASQRRTSRDPHPPVRVLTLKTLFSLGNISRPMINAAADSASHDATTKMSILTVKGTLTTHMQQYNRILSDLVKCRGVTTRTGPMSHPSSNSSAGSITDRERSRAQDGPACSCSCVQQGKDFSLSTNYGLVLNALAVYITRVREQLKLSGVSQSLPPNSLGGRAEQWISRRVSLFKEDFLTMDQEEDGLDEQEDESVTVAYEYDKELYAELHHLERATLLMPYASLAFTAIASSQLFKATRDVKYASLLADDLLPLLLQRIGHGRGMTLGAVERERTTIGAQAAGMLALAACYDVVKEQRREIMSKMRDTVAFLRRERGLPFLPRDEYSHAMVRIRTKGGYETQNYYWTHKAGLLLRALTRYRRMELRAAAPVYWTHREVLKMDSIAKVLAEYIHQCTVTINTTVTADGVLTITTRHTHRARTGAATGTRITRSYQDADPTELQLYRDANSNRRSAEAEGRSIQTQYLKRIQTHAGSGDGRTNAEAQCWATVGLMFQPWL